MLNIFLLLCGTRRAFSLLCGKRRVPLYRNFKTERVASCVAKKAEVIFINNNLLISLAKLSNRISMLIVFLRK